MTQQQQTNPALKPRLIVQQPAPDQEFPVGVTFPVSGKAFGVDGDIAQVTINSVTVQLDSGPPVNASLTNPTDPHAPPTEVDFSTTMQLTTTGNHSITVKAIDDVGGWISQTVAVSTPGTLHCVPGAPWQNYPQTESLVPFSTCTPESLEDIMAIVREAEASSKHVHAFGSKWSFSDCAISSDYVIDTTHLSRPLQKVQQALTPGQHPPLYHVEAGITIRDLYIELDQIGLALETMGGDSGQTLAGAVSTGTHGGDKFLGPLADSVLALHLVEAGGTQYWIEPSSGITDPSLLQKFVAPGIDPKNIIYDNATFDACLVSLGCMGIIYAVVLRVREQYDLVETTVATTWRGFLQSASTYLNDANNRFLQVAIDPYTDSNNENLCLVTTRAEAPEAGPVQPPAPVQRPTGDVATAVKNMIGDLDCDDQLKLLLNGVFDDTGLPLAQRFAKIVQGILSQTPDQRHVMVEHYGSVMQALWPTGTFRGRSYAVMDTTYPNAPGPSNPAYSIELFFQSIDVNGRLGFADFVDAAIAAINAATDTLLTGYVSLRFTGLTHASLGMEQWNQTCAVEISVVQGVQGELEVLTALLDKVYQFGGLPHWGQMIDLNVQGQGTIYPRFNEWKQVYARLSNNFTSRTFENALSSRWKLTTPDVAFFPGDGHLWHTERRPDGSWSGLGDVNAQFAIPGPVQAVSATSSQPGETQFMLATEDGHLWHTERRPDGTWSGLGDVNAQFAIPGAVRAVAAASSLPGESQFLFNT